MPAAIKANKTLALSRPGSSANAEIDTLDTASDAAGGLAPVFWTNVRARVMAAARAAGMPSLEMLQAIVGPVRPSPEGRGNVR